MTTDKLLFTPGPLTTSATVKAAMLRDAGSRDRDFIETVREIRERLLSIGGAASPRDGGTYECVLMQGSGTFAIESVISSAIPRDGKLLVLVNGAYGRRIAQMARVHEIETETLETPENCTISPKAVAERLGVARRHPRSGNPLRNDHGHRQSHRRDRRNRGARWRCVHRRCHEQLWSDFRRSRRCAY